MIRGNFIEPVPTPRNVNGTNTLFSRGTNKSFSRSQGPRKARANKTPNKQKELVFCGAPLFQLIKKREGQNQ